MDQLRGIAVLLVMAHHSPGPTSPNWLSGGWLGVDLFFVLSGYWIGGLLLRSYADTSSSLRAAAVAFWWRRARRLLPALAALMIAWTACAAAAGPFGLLLRGTPNGHPLWVAQIATWTGTVNIAQLLAEFPYSLGHLWSLSVEWQFYAAAPLLLAFMLGRPRRFERRTLAITLAVTALGAAVASAVIGLAGTSAAPVYLSSLGRAPALLLGLLTAVATSPVFPGEPWRPPASWRAPLLAGAGIPAVGLWLVADKTSIVWLVVAIPAMAACASVLVWTLATLGAPDIGRPAAATLAWAGRRSYGAYVWNWPITFVLTYWVFPERGWWLTVWVAVLAWTLTWVTAELSWRAVEDPWMTYPTRREWAESGGVTAGGSAVGRAGRFSEENVAGETGSEHGGPDS